MTFPVLRSMIKSSEVEEYKQLTCVMQFLRHTTIHVDHGTHLPPHYKVDIQYTLTYRKLRKRIDLDILMTFPVFCTKFKSSEVEE